MAKPLTFYQSLNQAPRSLKHGKHRRASAPPHGHSTDRASDRARGTTQIGAYYVSFDASGITFREPKPPTIPHAGIRTGELIGHRMWWLFGEHICSLAHHRLWRPGETVTGNTNEMIDVWGEIWGGTYSFFNRGQMAAEIAEACAARGSASRERDQGIIRMWGSHPIYGASALIVGTIKMWGDVVEHERGYRAEFAKLNSLDELYGEGNIEALRALYGVGALSTS